MMCLIGNLMGERDVPVLFQSTIMLLLPDNSTDFEEGTLWIKKPHKVVVQQAHTNFTTENQQNVHHRVARRSSCKKKAGNCGVHCNSLPKRSTRSLRSVSDTVTETKRCHC